MKLPYTPACFTLLLRPSSLLQAARGGGTAAFAASPRSQHLVRESLLGTCLPRLMSETSQKARSEGNSGVSLPRGGEDRFLL